MGKIKYYNWYGNKELEEELNENNLGNTNGMMIRCHLINGTEKVGFSDPFRTHDKKSYDSKVHDYIFLWTWDNLDEKTHQLVGDTDTKFNQSFIPVNIAEIVNVDVILFSNGRWGGKFTNTFDIEIK